MKYGLIFGLLLQFPLWAQLDEGWRQLADNNFEAARQAFETAQVDEDPLADIGWFLTHLQDGPTEALQDAALKVISRNPNSPASEFVMKWMYEKRQCMGGWVENVTRIIGDTQPQNPELKILYANTRRARARQREAVPEQESMSQGAGFATAWRISESFGAYAIPAFDDAWPPEKPDYWKDQAVTFNTPTGVVVPPTHAHGAGVFYAATSFENPVAQTVLFRLFSYHNLNLWVDGKHVFTAPALESDGPRVQFVAVNLGKGQHEVVLKTTQTRQANGQFSLQLTAAQPPVLPMESAIPSKELAKGKTAKQVRVGLLAALDGRTEPLADYVRSFLAQYDKDKETQQRLLEKLVEANPKSQIIGGSLSRLYLTMVDFLPQEEQLSRAFQILSELNQAPPVLLENRLSLGLLLIRARQTKVALELLKDVAARNPAYCEALEALMLVAKNENLPDVRQQVIKYLEDMGLSHRWAQQKLLNEAEDDADLERTRELLENLDELLPWEGYAADLREMDEDYLGAIEDMKKRAAIFPEQVYYPYAIAKLYAQLGDTEAQRHWYTKTREIHPTNRQALLGLVNLDCFEGKLEDAKQRLRDHLQMDPADAEFRQRLSHLEGRTAFEDFRVDTREVIRDAANKPPATDADSELLLDQLMVRLFPDGSQMRYTHLVTRVLTKDGVDSESELQLPEDLEILELRTIKADGQVLYPADIKEKASISLTGVSVGDFIDEEHIEYMAPAYYDPDGLDGSMSFIFQNVDRIYHHSELVLIYPEGLDPEPVLLSKNMPIEPEITTKDGLRIVRWLTKNLPPIRTEPAMPPQSYLHASATFYYNTTWEEIRDYYRNALRQRLDLSYRMEAKVAEWVASEPNQRKLAEKIYREITDKTEPGPSFYEDINRVWETGKGNPTLLLAAIYKSLGMDCEVVMARPEQLRHFVYDTPMPEFSYALLRLNLKGETIWLDGSRQSLPFGYVPFEYRGSRGLVIGDVFPIFETVPQADAANERIETSYTFEFDADGKMVGKGSESFFGSFAPQLAKKYESMNRPEKRQLVEAGMNETYPGAVVTKVAIPEDLPLATFEVVTDFTHDKMGTFEKGNKLELAFPMPRTPLLERYGTLPNRRTPVYIGSPTYNVAKIVLKLPEDYAWQTPTQTFEESTRFGDYSLKFTRKNAQTLILERTYIVPSQFVEPADYDEFLEFCKNLVKNEGTIFEAIYQAK